jgi:hypothetical protein
MDGLDRGTGRDREIVFKSATRVLASHMAITAERFHTLKHTVPKPLFYNNLATVLL